MEDAMQFLDELRDKCVHKVERAIDEWDYQDFSPDKRCALLDNEESTSIKDDWRRESNALLKIKPSQQAWVGISPDAELEDVDCGHTIPKSSISALGYEAKLVAVCTPQGGIQGIPDADSVQRLLAQIPRLDAAKVATAFAARLQDEAANKCWQVRAKALVLMQMLVEIKPFSQQYIPVFQMHAPLQQQLDQLRTSSQKQQVREGARKLLSLIRSGGSNPLLIAKEPNRLRGNSSESARKLSPRRAKTTDATFSPKSAATKLFKPAPVSTKMASPRNSSVGGVKPMVPSPKVSQAAMASWKRRMSEKENCDSESTTRMPYQKPPSGSVNPQTTWISTHPTSSITVNSGGAATLSRHDSGKITAFSFVH